MQMGYMFWLALTAGTGLLIGVLMMIGTTVYLNRSPKRFRLFELGYSNRSDWYASGKVDFFTANYVISHTVVAAVRMRRGWGSERARRYGSPLAPFLHIDGNYNKLIHEFPGFVRWELIKISVIAASIVLTVIGMGIDKDWW